MKRLLFTVIGLFVLCIFLVGCERADDNLSDGEKLIQSKGKLGVEKVYQPEWELGDYWVVKRTEQVMDKVDERYIVVVVENKTNMNVSVPLVAREGDINLRALYLRQPKTFSELISGDGEGDNRIDEEVYVLVRYEPTKLEPIYPEDSECGEPMYFQLDFAGDVLKKEQAYSVRDLSLVWDPDIPGRMLKMFHWPLQTGKYWSFPIVNVESDEGKQYVAEKLELSEKEGYDWKEHNAYGKGVVWGYEEGRFMIELFGLYPFYANYDKKEMTVWYDAENEFWDYNTNSNLAGIQLNLTEEVVIKGYGNLSLRLESGNPA
ncbi:hypothetical protein ACFL0V_04685, partial [Nanoarchaeota archaeon]